MTTKSKTTSFIDLYELLQMGGFKKRHIVFPSLLTIIASFLEGGGLAFLIPLAKGIVESDFKFVRDIPGFREIFDFLNHFFEISNATIFVALITMMFTCVVLKSIFTFVARVYTAKVISGLDNNFRTVLFDQYLKFGKKFHDENNAGKLHTILVGHTQRLFGSIYNTQELLSSFITILIYLVIMAMISWELTLFVLLIFPVLSASVNIIIKKIEITSQHHAQAVSKMSENISNALSCIPLVKAYSSEKKELEWFKGASHQLANCEFSMRKKEHIIPPIQEIVLTFMMVVLLGFMSLLLLRLDRGSVGSYLVFIYLLRRIAANMGIYDSFKFFLAKVYGVTQHLHEIFRKNESYYVGQGKQEFKGLNNEIVIQDLTFLYGDKKVVLDQLSLSIKKGQTTAIIGASGSGKSTIVNLLMRFYECPEGSVYFDGNDIRVFTLASLRKTMAYVTQETYLFNATLRKNLVYGLLHEPDNRVLLEAVKKAKLYNFLLKLPDGLETEIGDRGVRLSGGERQRVAIARTFLKNPEILILDEATSALDSITEKKIQQALNELTVGRTAIIIAHRLSTIEHADKIIVIEDGKVREEGNLQQLLEKKALFIIITRSKNLFDKQNMKVMFFETGTSGHPLTIIRYYLESILEITQNIILVVTEKTIKTDAFKMQLEPFVDKIEVDSTIDKISSLNILGSVQRTKLLDRMVAKHRPDYLFVPHSDGITQMLTLFGIFGGKRTSKKLSSEALMFRLSPSFSKESIIACAKTKILKKALSKLPWTYMNFTDPFVYKQISENMSLKTLKSIGLMPEGIENVSVIPTSDSRRKLNIPVMGRYIGCVGVMAKFKGIDFLLKAFAKAELKSTDRLLLMGQFDEDIRKQLALMPSHIRNRIIAVDRYISDEEMTLGLSAMDLVCIAHPRHKGNSHIQLRAAALKKPVLSTDYGTIGRLTKEFKLGYTTNVLDERSFSKDIKERLDDAPYFKGSKLSEHLILFHSIENFRVVAMRKVRNRMGLPKEEQICDWSFVESQLAKDRKGHHSEQMSTN